MEYVPKILHRVWLGDNPVPEEYESYWDGWKLRHPDWELITWTDATIPRLSDQRQFNLSPNYAMKSDFVRYEVVRRHGGVYVDSDFECLKNIQPLIDGVQFMTGWETNGRFLAGGLFASTPGHPLLEKLSMDIGANVRKVAAECREKGYYYAPHGRYYPEKRFAKSFLQSAQSGPLFFTNAVFDWLLSAGFYDIEKQVVSEPHASGVRLCDEKTFYPWKPWETGIRVDDEMTYAIHHYAASWVQVARDGR